MRGRKGAEIEKGLKITTRDNIRGKKGVKIEICPKSQSEACKGQERGKN